MTEKQIKKLEEKKEKIDNKICNLRALRQESKDKDDIEAIIEINAKIDKLRDQKDNINQKIINDRNKKLGYTFAFRKN